MKHTVLLPQSNHALATPQGWPLAAGRHRRRLYRPSYRHKTRAAADRAGMRAVAVLGGVSAAFGMAVYWSGPFVLVQAGLLALVLAAGLVLLRLRSCVNAVTAAAARISDGDRSVRVPGSGLGRGLAREVDGLIRSFNGMAAALDASERERAQVAAGVSHELRTPLTILMGRLHAIRDGVIPGQPAETERLLHQVQHILHIVDDLDAMAHADSGRMAFEWEYVDLAEVIRPVIADLQPLLARHGLTIRAGYCGARVLGDRHRLRQVFTNILTNAAKHSPEGGRITVALDVRDGNAEISVTDEGPGIAPADLENVFKPFWRSAASRRRPGCTGSGIGLALTGKLMRAHGGHVEAANRPDRSGACFRVVLPLA
ncbi:HAMP domain-containing sensor histidine kinase [Novosphingobium beihaiensis]|uniref:histidine kinase n=1 Tax=Novosphingobium beihaiensis TaxID=2930389 RepID=A0ABT0BLP3_9SPHN|nr:HAMP domain-containing sensor histidine kinase [Novosphingobium beihaiensis]MCJ2185949.1 HAMP domain-containing histidine kinase [Novosphingobium beihaiensis]